jgi:hypothetical protein
VILNNQLTIIMILNKLSLFFLAIPLVTLNFAHADTQRCNAEVVNVTGKNFARSFSVESNECKKSQCSGQIRYDIIINKNDRHVVNYGTYINYVIPQGKSRATVSTNATGAGVYNVSTHEVAGIKITGVSCQTLAAKTYYN